jgi:hypothetical protein
MIITLKGADFSASNIGTLSSWRISRSLGAGATYEGATSVDKGAAFSATVTLAEGYEVGTAGVTITMGGTVLSGAHSIEGNVITITIASVTGNVLIKVPTVNTAGGEEEPEVPDTPDTPDEPTAVNLFNKNSAGIRRGELYLSNKWTTQYADGWATSDYIPCSAGQQFAIYTEGLVNFFDANKTFVSKDNPAAGTVTAPRVVTVPNNSNIAYFHFAYKVEYEDIVMCVSGTEYPDKYIPYVG